MILKIGFFFELDAKEFVSVVEPLRRSEPDPDESRILAYLESGFDCGLLTLLDEDLLESPPVAIGAPGIRTDGKYGWPTTLVYYVKKYHIALPVEFVGHMRRNAWQVPTGIDVNAITWEGETQIG